MNQSYVIFFLVYMDVGIWKLAYTFVQPLKGKSVKIKDVKWKKKIKYDLSSK